MNMYDVQQFVHYNYKPLSTSYIFTRLITVWLLSGVCSLLGENKLPLGIGLFFCSFLVTAVALYIWKSGIKKMNNRFLWDGITNMYISIILNLLSYRLLAWQRGDDLMLLLFFVAATMLFFSISAVIVSWNIKKGRYNKEVQSTSKPAAPYILGCLAIIFTKSFLQTGKSQGGIYVLVMSLIILSAIMGLGWTSLIRLVLNKRLTDIGT